MNEGKLWRDEILTTKFFVPAPPSALISRPRLTALLNDGLLRKLTLLTAPAGFGKTTLLSEWIRTRQEGDASSLAWVSLDESDNNPLRFWSYLITALNVSYEGIGQQALAQLHAKQAPSIRYVLTTLINAMATGGGGTHYLLVLDNYHAITQQEIHDAFRFLLEHQPESLHVFLLTRVDPPLLLGRLRALGQVVELRSDQLRFTSQETAAFLTKTMGLSLPVEVLQAVEARSEGWIASLQLAALSLRSQTDPTDLLDRLRGDHRYILDYLTDEVLQQQPLAVQNFLQSTSILGQLNAQLCDALMEQTNSQQMLVSLERANLFVVALDPDHRWFRYHALFAEALRHRLLLLDPERISPLHFRASRWFAAHGFLHEAIQHAFLAQEWQWAADLIESSIGPGSAFFSRGESWMIQSWLQRLPEETVRTRPRLCLAYVRSLHLASQPGVAEPLLQAAEDVLLASSPSSPAAQIADITKDNIPLFPKDDERNRLLGEVLALRALAAGTYGNSPTALDLCQQAIMHLSEQDHYEHALVAYARALAFFAAGQAGAAAQSALECGAFCQAAGMTSFVISYMGMATIALHMQGQLRTVWRTCQCAIQLKDEHGTPANAAVGLVYAVQADILRERNQLDAALNLASQALLIGQQQPGCEVYLPVIYAVLVRIHVARGDIDTATEVLQQLAQTPPLADNPFYLAWATSVDQARLWLAHGDLERAVRWAEVLEHKERPISPFAREREDVARVRILLAQEKASRALDLLASLLVAAQTAERWDHVIEMLLLQALAYQIEHELQKALTVLAQAVSIAEPEGYARCFLDEGPSLATLLSKLQAQERKKGPTPYIDSLLAAFFPAKSVSQSANTNKYCGLSCSQRDPLSERELDVLLLLAQGASNQEIAEVLVVAVSTVKHHVSMILAKLQVSNRTQAVAQARSLGLLLDATPQES